MTTVSTEEQAIQANPAGQVVPRAKPDRMPNIDRLRLLALLEIVVYHTSQRTQESLHIFAGVGLPIFLMFTVALNARPRASESGGGFFRRKAAMFMIPWAAWSVIYAVSQTAAPLAKGSQDPFHWFEPEMLILGTQTHLWYLIFALLASLAAFAGYRATSKFSDLVVVIGGTVVAWLVLIPEPYIRVSESWQADWLLAAPAIPLGLALGRCVNAPNAAARRRLTLLFGGLAIPVLALIEIFHLGYTIPRFSTALLPMCLVVIWPGRADPVTARLTGMRLGVYLSHMLFIGALHFVGLDRLPLAVTSAIVVVGSFGLTWVLTLTPLRWLVQPNALRVPS